MDRQVVAPALTYGITSRFGQLLHLVKSRSPYRARGADREFYLKLWGGKPVVINRKGSHSEGPITLPDPFASVIGCITPDLLAELGDERGREDGFLHRVLFAFPDEPPPAEWTDARLSKEAAKAWADTLGALWALSPQMTPFGPRPEVVKLSPEARAVWADFYNAHQAELAAPDFPPVLLGPWAKLEGTCARIALILHHLSRVTCHTEGSDVASSVAVQGAVQGVTYLKSHARRVYERLPGNILDRRDDDALAWVRDRGGVVTSRDVQRHRLGGASNADQALALMERWAGRGLGTLESQGKGRLVFKMKG